MNDELYHHGIKGQKWGVRRFQNRDGTRTTAGKKRYSDDYKDATSKKSSKELSDSELRKRINRLQMEKQYKDLKTDSSAVGKGKRITSNILKGVAIGVATAKLQKYANKGADYIEREIKKGIASVALSMTLRSK